MIRKSTWITLAVFLIVLLAGLYLSKTEKTAETEKTATPTPVDLAVPGGTLKNLMAISFINHGTSSLRITKDSDGRWTFESPPQAPINQARVAEILSNINNLQVLSKMTSPINAGDLGLSPPAQEIDLVGSDNQTVRILIGSQTPTQSGYYFQVNESAPVIVDKGGLETIINLLTEENLKAQPEITPQ